MPQLTVPNEAMEVEYLLAATSSGPFEVPFSFYGLDDIRLFVIEEDGTTTELDRITHWTFTRTDEVGTGYVGYTGGEITLNAALGAGNTVKIFRDTVIDRLANYPLTGPFSIKALNDELNKFTHIMQELAEQKDNYISLPESAISTTPWDLSGRAAGSAGESAADDALATNRQVDASGPNWVADDNSEIGPYTEDIWNTIYSAQGIVIEGGDTSKLFDLMTQYFTFIQNRGGSEASFYVRYRYQVDCYAQVVKAANSDYPIKIPATSALPFSFMDIEQDIDYTNGNQTMFVAVDIYPIGSASDSLVTQWGNMAINTSEPR